MAAAALSVALLLAGPYACGKKAVAATADQPFLVCADAAGDGGPADLLSITAAPAADRVFLQLSFAAALPAGRTTVTLRSASPRREVAIDLRDSRPASVVMSADANTASAARPEDVVHVAGADIHVVLPGVMMPAEAHEWSAEAAVGEATDVCAAKV